MKNLNFLHLEFIAISSSIAIYSDWQSNSAIAILLISIFATLALGFLIYELHTFFEFKKFDDAALETKAKIIDIVKQDNSNDEYPKIEFQNNNSETINCFVESHIHPFPYEKDSEIPILYNPSNPKSVKINTDIYHSPPRKWLILFQTALVFISFSLIAYLMITGFYYDRINLENVQSEKRNEIITMISDGSLDIHEIDEEFGDRLIHRAVIAGDLDLVKKLIDLGADINAQITKGIEKGMTPLHFAILTEQSEITRFLINKHADIHKKDHLGINPFHLAVMEGDFETASILIKEGSNINEKDNDGMTALHIACLNNHTEMVKFLLEHNANIEIESGKGEKALDLTTNDDIKNYFTKKK